MTHFFFYNLCMSKKIKKSNGYKKLYKYIKPYKKETILALVLTMLEAALEMFIPFLMNYLLSEGVYYDLAQNKYTINTQNLIFISLLMVVCALLAFTTGTLSSKFIANSGRKFGANLRMQSYKKVEDFSFNNIDNFRQSSLITRLTDDNQIIQNTYCDSFRPIVRAPILLLCSIVFSLLISPILSIFLFISMIILCAIYYVVIKMVKPRYREMQKETDNLNQDTKEAISNVKTIKAYVKEDYEISKFDTINKDLRKTSNRSYGMTSLSMPLLNLVVFSTIIVILYVGGYFVINDKFMITTVNITAFLTYLHQTLGAFRMINNALTKINRADASIERTNELLDTKIDLVFNNDSKLKITSGDVAFKNVFYKSSIDSKNYILNDINLEIKNGEFIGIVGQTGSGKSSFVNLIDRFYDASKGEILINNNNIKEYNEYELHSKIAFCFQNPLLFKGTVIDNIRFGCKDATMEEVVKACKIACCYDFITKELDKGFDTEISEGGTNVSGGQRSRICIARAIITKPKILILDDSFSALDHITENTVKQNLDKYLKSTTKIVISQKISTIKNADRIVVINEGKINNIGTHKELLNKDIIYTDMCKSQKEGA